MIDHHCLPTGLMPDPILHLFLSDETQPTIRPKTGLSAVSEYRAYFLSPRERHPTAIEFVPGPVRDGRCGFWEIDPQLMPGLYGLQVPYTMRQPGYTYVYLCFTGARPHYLELHGVEYDRSDPFALGLNTWIRSTCHEHLTSGLRKSMPATMQPLLHDWFDRD